MQDAVRQVAKRRAGVGLNRIRREIGLHIVRRLPRAARVIDQRIAAEQQRAGEILRRQAEDVPTGEARRIHAGERKRLLHRRGGVGAGYFRPRGLASRVHRNFRVIAQRDELLKEAKKAVAERGADVILGRKQYRHQQNEARRQRQQDKGGERLPLALTAAEIARAYADDAEDRKQQNRRRFGRGVDEYHAKAHQRHGDEQTEQKRAQSDPEQPEHAGQQRGQEAEKLVEPVQQHDAAGGARVDIEVQIPSIRRGRPAQRCTNARDTGKGRARTAAARRCRPACHARGCGTGTKRAPKTAGSTRSIGSRPLVQYMRSSKRM